ncbi:MAG: hypothetical protein EBT57_07775, partial [Verrucomicrobia bacterium]|nr:hypothetical protein [Verrucomicrobiota bacterium]
SGGVVAYGYVDASGLFYDETDTNSPTRLYQRSYSVQLYTLAGNTTNSWISVPALEDTRISYGGGTETDNTGGNKALLLAKSEPADSANRTVSAIKFRLSRTNSFGQEIPIRPEDISLALMEVDAYQSAYRSSKIQATVYGTTNNNWRTVDEVIDPNTYLPLEPAMTWANSPLVKTSPVLGGKIASQSVLGVGSSAQVLGQIVVRTNTSVTKRLDVTSFLRGTRKSSLRRVNTNDYNDTNFYSTNFDATILVAQEPRWDKSQTVRTVDDSGLGDRQGAGVQIHSLETTSTSSKGPRLKLVLANDSDEDGLSDLAETDLYGTNPNNRDQNGNGVPDGTDLLIAGMNVKAGTSAGSANLITFTNLPVKNFGDAPFNLTATATAGTVTYTSANTNVATVSGNTVTIRGAGFTEITARCTGTATVGPAEPVKQILRVNKAKATISATGGVFTYNGSSRTATITTTPSGLSTIVTYNGSTALPVNAGEYAVQATILDSNYEGSLEPDSTLSTSSLLTILGSAQTVTFSSATTVTYGSSLSLVASSTGGGAISYEIVSGPGSLTGNMLTPTASSGTIVVRATAAATGGYASSSADQSITVLNSPSTVFFGALNPTNLGSDGVSMLLRYAFGGTTNGNLDRALAPTSSVSGSNLILTYYARTNDPALSVVPQVTTNIGSTTNWGTSGITINSNVSTITTNGVTLQKRTATVPVSGGARQFLRLKVTLTQ